LVSYTAEIADKNKMSSTIGLVQSGLLLKADLMEFIRYFASWVENLDRL
jgi:hypothetical protein